MIIENQGLQGFVFLTLYMYKYFSLHESNLCIIKYRVDKFLEVAWMSLIYKEGAVWH